MKKLTLLYAKKTHSRANILNLHSGTGKIRCFFPYYQELDIFTSPRNRFNIP